MGARRLFQTTIVLERRRDGWSNTITVEPALWSAWSMDEARGLAIPAAMEKHPGFSLGGQGVMDVTDTVRLWVQLNPAENSASSPSEASASALPPDESIPQPNPKGEG